MFQIIFSIGKEFKATHAKEVCKKSWVLMPRGFEILLIFHVKQKTQRIDRQSDDMISLESVTHLHTKVGECYGVFDPSTRSLDFVRVNRTCGDVSLLYR